MTKQSGATLIEFALVLILFLTVLLGVVDFARLLWTWNAASEATRWGARTAVVCEQDSAAVLARMKSFLPELTASNVAINWYVWNGITKKYVADNSCNSTNCAGVNVQLSGLDYQWMGPVAYGFKASFGMPGFSAFLPREVMGQDLNSASVCTAP